MSDSERIETSGRLALAELEQVIGNVTEQLAVFRRRALSAESRVRDLERIAADAMRSESELKAAKKRISELQDSLSSAERLAAEASEQAVAAVAAAADGKAINPTELVAENALLRQRLEEAVVRSRHIGERVRFLRQQLKSGGER